MPFGFMLCDQALELQARETLEYLAENAAYSIQGYASGLVVALFFREPLSTYQRLSPAFPKPNLDTCDVDVYLPSWLGVEASRQTWTSILLTWLGVEARKKSFS